jgi:hypothetical protein
MVSGLNLERDAESVVLLPVLEELVTEVRSGGLKLGLALV